MSKTGWSAILMIFTACLACEVSPCFAGYGERTYMDLHPPGWFSSKAVCINDSGEVAGFGVTAEGGRGFLWSADEDFPGTGFLKADPERRVQWRALLESLGEKPKIGIAWTGGLPRTGVQKRSLQLEDFLPILKSIDATRVSLQYKDPSKEIEQLQETHGITVHHWPRVGEAYDLYETA